jgi:hypothetical protein
MAETAGFYHKLCKVICCWDQVPSAERLKMANVVQDVKGVLEKTLQVSINEFNGIYCQSKLAHTDDWPVMPMCSFHHHMLAPLCKC